MDTETAPRMQDTRRSIMRLLKLRGPMTADALAEQLGITSMGVRGHLSALESDGLVRYAPQQNGVGRPAYLYSLTDAGDELFPRTYPQLANGLLEAIKALDGEGGLDRVFEKRTEWLEAQYRARMMDRTLEGRVAELARIRAEEGYMADWERLDDDTFVLRENNCAIFQIASTSAQACRFELELFRRVLGDAEVTRESHMISGDRVCAYVIRRRQGAV